MTASYEQSCRERERERERQTDRQTDRERQTDRQTESDREREINTYTIWKEYFLCIFFKDKCLRIAQKFTAAIYDSLQFFFMIRIYPHTVFAKKDSLKLCQIQLGEDS